MLIAKECESDLLAPSRCNDHLANWALPPALQKFCRAKLEIHSIPPEKGALVPNQPRHKPDASLVQRGENTNQLFLLNLYEDRLKSGFFGTPGSEPTLR